MTGTSISHSAAKSAQGRHHRRRRDRAWHCLAAGRQRGAAVDGVRPRRGRRAAQATPPPGCSRPAARPSRARKRWLRSGARARRAGRPSRRSCCRPPASTSNCGTEGTLVVALTADDQARHPPPPRAIRRSSACRWNGFPPPRRAGASRISPASSPARCGRPEDHQVDNRKLAAALRVAAEARRRDHPRAHAGRRRFRSPAARADGVVLADGSKVAADVVVLAAGAWSRTHWRARARAAAAGAADQGPDAGAAHGSGGAADDAT